MIIKLLNDSICGINPALAGVYLSLINISGLSAGHLHIHTFLFNLTMQFVVAKALLGPPQNFVYKQDVSRCKT